MHVLVATPWYPTPNQLNSGIFIAEQVDALIDAGLAVTVLHFDALPTKIHAAGPSAPKMSLASLPNHEIVSFQNLSNTKCRYIRLPFVSVEGAGFAQRAYEAKRMFSDFVDLHPDFLEDIDLIHGHVICPTFEAIKDSGKPLVITEHYSGIERVISQKASKAMVEEAIQKSFIITVSRSLKHRIFQALKVREKDFPGISVIPNIVNSDDLPTSGQKESEGHSPCRWLYVGSLKSNKQADLLIESFETFKSSNRNALLTVVGDGEEMMNLRKLTERLNLADSVKFVGALPRSEVSNYYRTASVFVHLSKSETFGIASVEAILAGVPVVSLRNEGADEAWGAIEFSAGKLLPMYSNRFDVAGAVHEVLERVTAVSLSEAQAWIANRYSSQAISSQVIRCYEEALTNAYRSD